MDPNDSTGARVYFKKDVEKERVILMAKNKV
jgi:hypothetical protein